MPEASLPVASARPSLRIEGQAASDLDAALFEMVLMERTDGMANAELVFGNWGTTNGAPGYPLFDRQRLEFGKRIEVRIADTRVFEGRITALEGRFPTSGAGNAEIAVYAEDKLQDLRMTRRTRSFDQVSDADAARRIASDHGISAQIDLSGPTHQVLSQVNQSDLAFLRDRVRALNGEIWIEDGSLHVAQRSSRTTGNPLELSYGNSLQRFDVRADLANQRTALSVSGWSPADKQAIKEEATDSVLSNEVAAGDGGIGLLQRAFGARAENVAHLHPVTAAEARAISEGWLRHIGRRFVCGSGTAGPEPRLRTGKRVDLRGLGALFNGIYTLTEVCHRFDVASGLRTDFCVERAAIGRP